MSWQDYNELGDKMHKAGWYKDAVDYYNKAIGIKPNESIIYFNRGVSKYSLKDYKGAIADFEYTIYLNPNDNVAKSFLSMAKEGAEKNSLHLQNNSSKQKAKSFKTVKSPIKYTYPKYNIIQPIKPIKKLSYEDYYNSGIKKLNEKKYQTAILDFTNSIKLNPNYINSYINRGWAYFELKKYDESIEDFNSAIRINPKNANLYFDRGVVKNNKGDYYGAIADYSGVIQSDSKNWRSYLYRGDNYYRVKKYFSALNDFKTSLSIQKSDETISRINSLRQDFKTPVFLIKNFKDIFAELGYWQALVLLFCIIILFTNIKSKQITFTEYNQNYIFQRFHFERLNINTPIPKPEEFNLDRNRIEYLKQIYQQTKNKLFNGDESPDYSIFWSIVLGCFLCSYINEFLMMYFDLPNEILLYVIETGILSLIVYCAIKKFLLFFKPKCNVTSHELQNYLLYKGALELYNEKMAPIKAAEEERQRKIREKEERKLRQQRSYWEKYWADIQKDEFAFEREVGELYKYKVTVTRGTGDGGVDLILKKDGETTIVQCKAWLQPVGPEPVRALWGVREDFNATKAIFVAYSGVTSGAWDFAKGKDIQIISVDNLIDISMQVYADKRVS